MSLNGTALQTTVQFATVTSSMSFTVT